MDTQTFESIVDRRIALMRKTLSKKQAEYARDDRLHNFKVAARCSSIVESPERALLGMLKKHWVSICDMVEYGGTYPRDVWDEKIGDMVNYLVLLEALVTESAGGTDTKPVTRP